MQTHDCMLRVVPVLIKTFKIFTPELNIDFQSAHLMVFLGSKGVDIRLAAMVGTALACVHHALLVMSLPVP